MMMMMMMMIKSPKEHHLKGKEEVHDVSVAVLIWHVGLIGRYELES